MLDLTVPESKVFYESKPEHEYKGDTASRIVLNMALPFINRGFRFLDVGAGTGALIKNFRKRWNDLKHIEGIDIAPKDPVVDYGDCTKLKYSDGLFDCVFCTDVIEHLSEDILKACISEIHRVLKVGGLLILTTLNKENLNQKIVCCPECGRKFHCHGHCQSFDIDSVRNLLSGFTVRKHRELNLNFIALFGSLAKLFYLFRLYRIKPVYLLTRDLFVVAQKG